jgi:transposase
MKTSCPSSGSAPGQDIAPSALRPGMSGAATQGVKGFQLLPRRWVVERTFAWFGRRRRLAKDFEGAAATEAAWLVAHTDYLLAALQPPITSAEL